LSTSWSIFEEVSKTPYLLNTISTVDLLATSPKRYVVSYGVNKLHNGSKGSHVGVGEALKNAQGHFVKLVFTSNKQSVRFSQLFFSVLR
jgi:hypothetical protein